MLSYQHGYHAGNLADLHKHIVLTALWSTLKRKPRPLSYVETHAGRGLYGMGDEFAQKTGEQAEGIVRYQGGAAAFDQALKAARAIFGDEIYPGSPALIAAQKDAGDQIHLAELHPQEHKALKAHLGQYAQVHHRDGYEMAQALAPFDPRRGLVLIDPSYEVKSEYDEIPKAVGRILRKWPQAVVAIWYPILADKRHLPMVSKLETQGQIRSEVVFKRSNMRMTGSGMLILNAPYGAKDAIQNDLLAIAEFVV